MKITSDSYRTSRETSSLFALCRVLKLFFCKYIFQGHLTRTLNQPYQYSCRLLTMCFTVALWFVLLWLCHIRHTYFTDRLFMLKSSKNVSFKWHQCPLWSKMLQYIDAKCSKLFVELFRVWYHILWLCPWLLMSIPGLNDRLDNKNSYAGKMTYIFIGALGWLIKSG